MFNFTVSSVMISQLKTVLGNPNNRKTMTEWLVVVYDRPGSVSITSIELDRVSSNFLVKDRSKFRPQHLEAIPKQVANGKITNAGAIFHEVPKEGQPLKFAGSSLNVVADSKEEVLEILKQDIFAKENIWDVENALIYPYGVAVRVAK